MAGVAAVQVATSVVLAAVASCVQVLAGPAKGELPDSATAVQLVWLVSVTGAA
ncbi:MAG: hypothetical protein IPJ48_11435 [Propionivibrio sp.]|uniref:Uncharacterized protein n=1 Tax=Candidatus Propionivibrio dominans TaxID=2954373 RepID=A0A9D7FF43_9RHOO|nr:hypothetical protein [Candidatus Propionivibrio dominans]